MPEHVTFYSDGVKLVGYVYRPTHAAASQPRAAVLICHGFGAHQERYLPDIARYLSSQGYIAMTFDYRGFGESEGPRWRLIPLEQIADIRNALTFLQLQGGVDPARLALYGTSFGGANVVVTASLDKRVKCVVSVVGVGNGERWMRSLRRGYEMADLRRQLAQDWKERVLTGKSRFVPRTELMLTDPASAAEAAKMAQQFPLSCTELPLETGQAVLDYAPDEAARKVSCPALFIVAENDVLVPNYNTREVYDNCPQPKKWVTIPGIGHYDAYYDPAFSQVMAATNAWCQEHLPPLPA